MTWYRILVYDVSQSVNDCLKASVPEVVIPPKRMKVLTVGYHQKYPSSPYT